LALGCACGSGGGPDAAAPDASRADGAPTPDAAPKPDATPPPVGATCGDPIVVDTVPATIAGDTTGMGNESLCSCSAGTQLAPDVVYRVSGDAPRDLLLGIEVDLDADPVFDAVLYARSDCLDPASELACAAHDWGERIDVLDAVGDVYVTVDGTPQFGGAHTGAYTLTVATRGIAGTGEACDPDGALGPPVRCASGSLCQNGVCVADSPELACKAAVDLTLDLADGAAEATGTTWAYAASHAAGSCAADPDAAFAEHIFRIDLAAAATLDASTDHADATTFDTYLYLRANACDGAEIACHDDVDLPGHNLRSHLVAAGLAPGTYYLFVDGSSPYPGTGAYKLTVTVTPE
jgi:hypothetical protein